MSTARARKRTEFQRLVKRVVDRMIIDLYLDDADGNVEKAAHRFLEDDAWAAENEDRFQQGTHRQVPLSMARGSSSSSSSKKQASSDNSKLIRRKH
jgi:hypothetical protein